VDEDVLDEDFLLYTARPVNALATSTKMWRRANHSRSHRHSSSPNSHKSNNL
jgi:hypothetical protein